jgi:hypothetical protein
MHPVLWIAPEHRSRFFQVIAFCTILVAAVLGTMGQVLHTPHAPMGVLSFELAFTAEALRLMIAEWMPYLATSVGFQLGLDFLLIPLYALALSAALLYSRKEPARWIHILAWLLLVAGACDGVENLCLLTCVITAPTDALALAAGLCASVKFAILVVALIAWPYLRFTAK